MISVAYTVISFTIIYNFSGGINSDLSGIT
jgi:hypothetical protein